MKSFRRLLYRPFGRAISDLRLFEPNDNVLLCVSGGVDSFAMLMLFSRWKGRVPFNISAHAIHIDLFEKTENVENIQRVCDMVGIPLTVVSRPIDHIKGIFDKSRGLSRCYVCARERRLLIFKTAERLCANKIVFAHNLNDFWETLALNILYHGRIEMLSVKQPFFGNRFMVVRPLCLIPRSHLVRFIHTRGIDILDGKCEYFRVSRRLLVRRVIDRILRNVDFSKGMSRALYSYFLERC